MSWFKRVCLVLFSLITAFCLFVLFVPLTRFQPFNTFFALHLVQDVRFFLAVEVLVGISLFGCLCVFFSAFGKRAPNDLYLQQSSGSTISVSRQAIASQATFLAEKNASVSVEKVVVHLQNPNKVEISMALKPRMVISVARVSQEIEQTIRKGITTMLGFEPASITLRFVEGPTVEEGMPAQDVVSDAGITQDISVDIEDAQTKVLKKGRS